jgi:hypothetical protein
MINFGGDTLQLVFIKANLILQPQVLKNMDIPLPEEAELVVLRRKAVAVAGVLQSFGYTAFLDHAKDYAISGKLVLCVRKETSTKE